MKRPTTLQEGLTLFAAERAMHEENGIIFPGVMGYATDAVMRNYQIALDAQPALQTDPNAGIPVMLQTLIDPDIYEVLYAPVRAAEILSEVKKGSWTDKTAMFPVTELTGEVTSYGDFNDNGRSDMNINFPQRAAYLFQTFIECGDLEIDQAGLARVNLVSTKNKSAANSHNRYANYTYFFGVQGLLNYGLLNDPNLAASLSPATKTAGGTAWVQSGVVKATASEIFLDIEDTFIALVNQTAGLVNRETKMTLALSPQSEAALVTLSTFNVSVSDMLKKSFPNLRVISAVQYQVLSASNPEGIAGGNLMQLIADDLEGQKTAFCAYNEKMRAHPMVRASSSFRQKTTGGTWGTVVRMPVAIASMLGI